MVLKNFYLKLSANNITLSIFKEFFLKKIENSIQADAFFFHSLIKKASSVKKVNIANSNKNMSAITFLATKSKKDCWF